MPVEDNQEYQTTNEIFENYDAVDDHDPNIKPWGMEHNQFCMLMHLSQFAGVIVPFAGLVLPIVMWQTNKDQSQIIDKHGKNIANWMISAAIYGVISAILIIVLIGIPMLLALGIMSIVFSILGGIKANDGKIYKYPMTIEFLK